MMKMKQPYLTYAVDSNGKLVHVDDVPKVRRVVVSAQIARRGYWQDKEKNANIIFRIFQELNANMLMSQCCICWQRKKYKRHFMSSCRSILSLNIPHIVQM